MTPITPPPSVLNTDIVNIICFGCQQTLSTSPIIASVSGYHNWHINCLCCTKCGRQLSQSRSCYIRNGRIYCKDDNCKLIIKCSKCDRIISSNDWVRRAGLLVYHLACFACDLCQRQLSTGEKFTLEKQQQQPSSLLLSPPNSINSNSSQTTLINNQQQQQQLSYRLVCKLHFGIDNITNIVPSSTNQSTPTSTTTTTTTTLNNKRSHSSLSSSSSSTNNLNHSNNSNHSNTNNSKTKRVRTTFTEDQLSVLQANFQQDSNPDGQDLERIATLTGLSKRVTQVWFQNSRARQKKFMNKSTVSHHSPHSHSHPSHPSLSHSSQTNHHHPHHHSHLPHQQHPVIQQQHQQQQSNGNGLWSPGTTTTTSSSSSTNSQNSQNGLISTITNDNTLISTVDCINKVTLWNKSAISTTSTISSPTLSMITNGNLITASHVTTPTPPPPPPITTITTNLCHSESLSEHLSSSTSSVQWCNENIRFT
uniref:LIM/homeobox protein Lhx9-like n=1 Tax=Dermatophagoides pteronyssinus TaxID=6956 RepID=A0A6P6XS35_DERPT|nr:LIM/homeobox protein Lhx9-like [Dermatophagoides pteronyssinus]